MLNSGINAIIKCRGTGLSSLIENTFNKSRKFLNYSAVIPLIIAVVIPVFGSTAKIKHSNCDDTNFDSLSTEIDPGLILNAQGVDVGNTNIAYRKNHLYVFEKENPEFCLDISLKIDTSILDHSRLCYKSTRAKENIMYGIAGFGKSHNQKIQNYLAGFITTHSSWGKRESEITISQFVSHNDSSFAIKIKITSDSAGMIYKSDIRPPLRMNITKTECKSNGDCRIK